MTKNDYTVFNALVDIVASPAKALDKVQGHASWLWWPLLISCVVGAAVTVYYNLWVDFDWLIDETIRSLPADAPPESAEAVSSFMTPERSAAIGGVAVVLMTFAVYLIQAVYLNLANKLATGAEIRFGQWFSLSAWTGFVGIFNTLIMFGVLLLADNNRVGQADLLPLSMNSLFIHANMGDAWFNWGNSLTLVNFWILALLAIGYARWTGASLLKSTIVAVLPWAVIFGGWAALI